MCNKSKISHVTKCPNFASTACMENCMQERRRSATPQVTRGRGTTAPSPAGNGIANSSPGGPPSAGKRPRGTFICGLHLHFLSCRHHGACHARSVVVAANENVARAQRCDCRVHSHFAAAMQLTVTVEANAGAEISTA